ncbi:uncharacterized protein DNG_04638 [Cephalotrichum gorgonifer]|uniref:DUF4246 domain-containing protein n=1 Tax=Cephalotrichum gorgonifer TaxID=2041049 RepID=A0AAE8SUR3_9PEZI|nr:uncharacterized protein DNG_04638 [Cephalotrichum gorgonifer]
MDASEQPGLRVPGVGKPVQDQEGAAFPSAVLGDWHSVGVTLREKRMLAFVDEITDKPEWERKVFDDEIVEKWRAEGSVRPEALEGDVVLSDEMFDFCIKELRDKAAIYKETGLINVLDAELIVVKSDVAVPTSVQNALRAGVKVLEDVPDRLKDWHPNSNDMVLDLVHPSLFPVAYGLTKVLLDEKVPLDGCIGYIGKGMTIDPFTPVESHDAGPLEWGSFQWLPTDVSLTDAGAKILGYVNNLHPVKNRDLYKVLEDVVTAAVPMWEEALVDMRGRLRIQLEYTGEEDWSFPEGLKYRIPDVEEGPGAYYDPNTQVRGNGEDYPDEDWMYEDDFEEWKREHRSLIYREPREYKPQSEVRAEILKKRGTDSTRLRDNYPAGLQVIFKLANIHLTPEKPTYEGGSWHVEGGLNELICASAIYYFDQENITDSHLAFRHAVDAEEVIMIPQQSEYESIEKYLGVEQDGAPIQTLGQVLTREGRLIAFPNFVQHQVQPFSLRDVTKPGHRKILAMFLVDPGRRLLSTSNVPPQRRDWWAEELRNQGILGALPAELADHTVDLVDEFPISWEKAVEMREKLMGERSIANENLTARMLEESFSFCEH